MMLDMVQALVEACRGQLFGASLQADCLTHYCRNWRVASLFGRCLDMVLFRRSWSYHLYSSLLSWRTGFVVEIS